MIELQHALPEPVELARHRKKNPGGSWGDESFKPVRKILRHQLNREQEGLCVYCESSLPQDKGHVEHIKSKGLNSALTFVYDNLAHSCSASEHCGHRKLRQVLPIEPRPNCNKYFVLMALDGRLKEAEGLAPQEVQDALDTLKILNLNAAALAWQRKGYIDSIRYLPEADQAAFVATAPFRWSLKGFLT